MNHSFSYLHATSKALLLVSLLVPASMFGMLSRVGQRYAARATQKYVNDAVRKKVQQEGTRNISQNLKNALSKEVKDVKGTLTNNLKKENAKKWFKPYVFKDKKSSKDDIHIIKGGVKMLGAGVGMSGASYLIQKNMLWMNPEAECWGGEWHFGNFPLEFLYCSSKITEFIGKGVTGLGALMLLCSSPAMAAITLTSGSTVAIANCVKQIRKEKREKEEREKRYSR